MPQFIIELSVVMNMIGRPNQNVNNLRFKESFLNSKHLVAKKGVALLFF